MAIKQLIERANGDAGKIIPPNITDFLLNSHVGTITIDYTEQLIKACTEMIESNGDAIHEVSVHMLSKIKRMGRSLDDEIPLFGRLEVLDIGLTGTS